MAAQQKKEKPIPWEKLRPWMRRAYDHGVRTEGWFALKVGSKEHAAWAAFFHRLGWTPSTFRTLSGDSEWTAPCQWPEWMETAEARALAKQDATA